MSAMDVVGGTDIVGSHSSPASPFPITIGLEQAVAHHGWVEARDRVLSAALNGRRLVLVLGAPGSGKSLLLQEIARTLRADGAEVLLLPRGELVLKAVETGMTASSAGRRRVVLVDEADQMTAAALDRLARLGACTFVLAGMRDPGDEQLDGWSPTAAATVVRLAPLPPGEVRTFVAARLAQSGLSKDALTEAAVAQLAAHSGGMPRVLNMLASGAFFLARAEQAHCVEAAHVDQAAALRDGGEGTNAAASAVPAAPSVIPRRQTESLPFPAAAMVPLPAPVGGVRGPRRRQVAVLGMAAGIAAACAGIVAARYGDHLRHSSPPMVAGQQSRASSVPVAPAPQLDASAASSPAATVARSEAAAPSPAPPVAPAASSSVVLRAAPQQPRPEALPSGAPGHVVLRYVRGSADAAAWTANLARTLRAAGFTVDALVPVARSNVRPGARYFFAEDQTTADAVLRAAGLASKGILADAKGLNAQLRPGLIELTLPPDQLQVGSRRPSSGDGRS